LKIKYTALFIWFLVTLQARAAAGGDNALWNAALNGDRQAVENILAGEPALLNAKNDRGYTPLHETAWKGHAGVAGLLLSYQATVDSKYRQLRSHCLLWPGNFFV